MYVNFILYFTQFALPLWTHTRTYLCIYVFSVASLIVVVASTVDVVIAVPAAAAVLEVA